MPAENIQFLKREKLLTFEEIESFVRCVVPVGVNKIRLTGGEPLVRRDLSQLVRMIAGIDGIKDIGMTTNGIFLAEHAQDLFDAGLRRLNISLDALDPVRFREVTRRDGYESVVKGIETAKKVGFHPIKINAVSIRGCDGVGDCPVWSFRTRVWLRSEVHRIHATRCGCGLGETESSVCRRNHRNSFE